VGGGSLCSHNHRRIGDVMTEKTKQVMVARTDLFPFAPGRVVAQACHASVMWLCRRVEQGEALDTFSDAEREWVVDSFTKVVLRVDTEDALFMVAAEAELAGLMVEMMWDDNVNPDDPELRVPTCIAIGPDWASKIDPITRKLRLL
jgi:PTH2 family peptidyl-tRNA hydrolase